MADGRFRVGNRREGNRLVWIFENGYSPSPENNIYIKDMGSKGGSKSLNNDYVASILHGIQKERDVELPL